MALKPCTDKAVNGILGTDIEGLTTQAMQQGGIGLLLTVLIVTVPPAAAMFFQGTVRSFSTVSGLGYGSGTSRGVPAATNNLPPTPPQSMPSGVETGPVAFPGLAHRSPNLRTEESQ